MSISGDRPIESFEFQRIDDAKEISSNEPSKEILEAAARHDGQLTPNVSLARSLIVDGIGVIMHKGSISASELEDVKEIAHADAKKALGHILEEAIANHGRKL